MRMLIVAEPQLGWPGKWEEREAIRAAHVRAVGDRSCKCLHRTRRKPATGEWATDANVTEAWSSAKTVDDAPGIGPTPGWSRASGAARRRRARPRESAGVCERFDGLFRSNAFFS